MGGRFPPLLTNGRILSQYNVGAQTRRTENTVWHPEDQLEIHPHDAETLGIAQGGWIKLASRAGETTLRATNTDRISPGVVDTTFHHPDTQANVVTTDYSGWATNCPENKVKAVQVSAFNGPTAWQQEYGAQAALARRILPAAEQRDDPELPQILPRPQMPPEKIIHLENQIATFSRPSPAAIRPAWSPVICAITRSPGCASRSAITSPRVAGSG